MYLIHILSRHIINDNIYYYCYYTHMTHNTFVPLTSEYFATAFHYQSLQQ